MDDDDPPEERNGQGPERLSMGSPENGVIGSPRWLRRWLRVLLLAFAVCATAIILYGMVQLFICDLREFVFPGLPRRVRWLCP